MVSLKVDVIEIADISNESYQQLLYKLAQPMTMDSATELTMEIEYMLSSGNAKLSVITAGPNQIWARGYYTAGDKIPYAQYIQPLVPVFVICNILIQESELNITLMAHLNQQI